MKKKFCIVIMLICMCLTLGISNVNATDTPYSDDYVDDCTTNGTCILLCGYTNKVEATTFFTGDDIYYNYYSSYIYYYFNKSQFTITWYYGSSKTKAITDDLVFIDEVLLKNFSNTGACPDYSYIDVAGLSSEVCFTNSSESTEDSGNYCTNTSSSGNPGTTFEGESTLEYNYEEEINIYFDDWILDINEISCEDFRKLNFDLDEQFVTDFKENFLYGNEIPDFMYNSVAYQTGLETLDEKSLSLKTKCDNEAEADYQDDKITEEEYNEILEQNEEAYEEMQSQIASADETIRGGKSFNTNTGSDCNSLLGGFADDVENILTFIKYLGPILVVIFTTIDFIKSASSGSQDDMKSASQKFVKRAIAAVLLFFIPTIINLIFDLVGITSCISS